MLRPVAESYLEEREILPTQWGSENTLRPRQKKFGHGNVSGRRRLAELSTVSRKQAINPRTERIGPDLLLLRLSKLVSVIH